MIKFDNERLNEIYNNLLNNTNNDQIAEFCKQFNRCIASTNDDSMLSELDKIFDVLFKLKFDNFYLKSFCICVYYRGYLKYTPRNGLKIFKLASKELDRISKFVYDMKNKSIQLNQKIITKDKVNDFKTGIYKNENQSEITVDELEDKFSGVKFTKEYANRNALYVSEACYGLDKSKEHEQELYDYLKLRYSCIAKKK